MADTFTVACPECSKKVNVTQEHVGKKVRCKGCEEVFTIKAPGGATGKKAPPPAPAEKGKAKEKGKGGGSAPPKPPEPPKDDEENANPYGLTQTDDHLARCPFCAQLMPSQEAIICLSCGYNTRTRNRPQVKAVYQATAGEVFTWLLPGIACVLTMIGFIVWYILFWGLIEEWMKGSIFEEKEGQYIGGMSPGMFRLYMGLILVFLSVPLIRFSYKRLIKENKPPERKIKDEE